MLRKLEKYEILSEIGHGGMATVYRARDSRLDREVAIKILHPHLRGADEARARFTREARSVARLRHPNILEIYDNAEESSDESFIVTELLTGPTLKAFVESTGAMPAEVAACFGVAIARALGAAHGAGIVHRDVKPENVLLHQDRSVKLTDFGIAQMVDSQSFTATGQILGSPGHMAPEQVDGADCDARSDIFSLGTVLYYLATGELPFQGRTPHQILRRIIDSDYPDPVRVTPTMGERLAAIIRSSLARSPGDRQQSAAEIEAALRANVAEIGIDEPEKVVERYLANPDGVRKEIETTVSERLPVLAERALEARDVPLALAYINRVLAFDPKNERVLALLKRLGRRRTVRAWVIASGSLLGLAGVVGMGLAVWGPPAPAGPPVEALSTTPVRAAAPTPTADATRASGKAATPVRSTAAKGESDAPRRFPMGPREVVFRPSPQNVSISVDDGPVQPYGPSFRSVRLTPGRHTFRFLGAEDCCEEETIARVIQPGPQPFVLEHDLKYRPALLYVSANVLANVVVDDGLVSGRTRSVISVPMARSIVEVHRITVSATGYKPYSTEIQLRAGKDRELKDVRLERLEGAP